MNPFLKNVLLTVCLLAGAGMCIETLLYAYHANGSLGFPLDDPWIHLQFAKNLHDYGSFSYYKNEMVTSGSTSPLYTLILSMGFFVTSNEMILSYVLGITVFVLAGFWMFKIVDRQIEHGFLYAAGAVIMLLCEPRLLWVALSGMETTLFLFLLLAVYFFYRTQRSLLFGIASGCLLWCRPEALLFFAVIGLDVVYTTYIVASEDRKKKSDRGGKRPLTWLKQPLIIVALSAAAYIGFNFWLSGSILPNTYAAKLAYYSHGGANYLEDVLHYFTDGHLLPVTIFVVIEMISIVMKVVKRQPQVSLISLIWSVGLFLAYWKNLPYLYQEGRYLMPVLPFYILLGIGGVSTVTLWIKQFIKGFENARVQLVASGIILALFCVQTVLAGWAKQNDYAFYCNYITNRQVRTAHWLKDNLPAGSVIATHDVGAIAFYSGKKIVDMVGLISPEMIKNIGDLDKLKSFLAKKNATHLVVLRNWFEIDNQSPLFQTDVEHPEIMQVFSYHSSTTHFIPQNVSSMIDAAGYYLSQGNVQQAGPLIAQAVQIDPQSSKAHFLLGRALLMIGKPDQAEKEFLTSSSLYPSYLDAEASLAEIDVYRHHEREAIHRLDSLITNYPSYANGYRALAEVYRTLDSTKANAYMLRYNELIGRKEQ